MLKSTDNWKVLITSLTVVTAVVGLFLNALVQLITKDFKRYLPRRGVVLSVNNRNRYNMSYYFMKQLSLADCGTCLIAIPITLVAVNTPFEANVVFCKALGFLNVAMNTVTLFNIMVIAYYRYCLVVYPLKIVITFQQVRKYVRCCWVCGFASASVFIYIMKPSSYNDGKMSRQDCILPFDNVLAAFLALLYLIFTSFIPVLVTIYMSVKTIKVSWKQNALYNKKHKVTNMFVTVIAAFVLTHAIYTVCLFAVALPVVHQNPKARVLNRIIILTSSFVSPVVNPLVYAFQLKNFRKKLWRKMSQIVLCDNCQSYHLERDETEEETLRLGAVTLVRYEMPRQPLETRDTVFNRFAVPLHQNRY